MKVCFANNKLRKQLSSISDIKRHFGNNAKRVATRIADMEAADNLEILIQIPPAKCHPLLGDKKGLWAVSVSANHRLIFEILNDPIPIIRNNEVDVKCVDSVRIVKIEDYH